MESRYSVQFEDDETKAVISDSRNPARADARASTKGLVVIIQVIDDPVGQLIWK